jgi:hypothetical protein
VKKHSSEAFYALDNPLEAAVYSVLVEMLKVRSAEAKMGKIGTRHVSQFKFT